MIESAAADGEVAWSLSSIQIERACEEISRSIGSLQLALQCPAVAPRYRNAHRRVSRLRTDCLRHLSPHPEHNDQWAVHVPLGKLHSERWVPADEHIRQIVARILLLRGTAPLAPPPNSCDWLLREPAGRQVSYPRLSKALAQAAQRAACSAAFAHISFVVTLFATEMLRAGISLPVLKELLGHHDIRMTMVYVAVTQNDLQRQYHRARQILSRVHVLPDFPNGQAIRLVHQIWNRSVPQGDGRIEPSRRNCCIFCSASELTR